MSWILVVEDEPALCADLVDYLCMRGFQAEGVGSASAMTALLSRRPSPAVVILDIGLPDGDGRDLASGLRVEHRCGIIMLSALRESGDRVRGYDSGADIYLVKDTSLREIEAAVNSLLRRLPAAPQSQPQPQPKPAAAADQWVLHRPTWTLVAPDHGTAKLTATEMAFLTVLMGRINETCLREELAQALARRQTAFDNRHLDAVVSRLRRKIEKTTALTSPIKVIYGVGYIFTGAGRID